MPHAVTLIPGDGVGPELTEAARRVIDSSGAEIAWETQQAGVAVMEQEGTPLPDRVLDSIRRNKVALKGPITTPRGGGIRSVNVARRRREHRGSLRRHRVRGGDRRGEAGHRARRGPHSR